MTEQKTTFGYRQTTPDEKTRLVQGVFDRVAGRYDLMNDLMSLGIHRLWKNQMVSHLRLHHQARVLDVAGGTGDIAFRLLQMYPHLDLQTIICDLTPAMLEKGRDRAVNKGIIQGLEWVCGSGEALPIPDQSIDLYTVAFGLRNITNIPKALSEAARVLKPGGQFACLEFSKVTTPSFERLYDFYSFNVLPMLGEWIAKDRESYQYLVESIRVFPDQLTLSTLISETGLKNVDFQNFCGGIAALHTAQK